MPRVLNVDLPIGPPPAGIKANCNGCHNTLKTVRDEKIYTAHVEYGKPGWLMYCPICGKLVFFPKPDSDKKRP